MESASSPEMPSASDKQMLLLEALQNLNFEAFKALVEDPEVNVCHKYGKPHFATILTIASRHKSTEEFVKLLLTKVKPNLNRIMKEPIHYAASNGTSKILQVLLNDKRVKVNAEDSDGRTALHLACTNFKKKDIGYEECIQLLMSHPEIDINRPNRKWFIPIHEAATCCKEAVVAVLTYARQDLELDRYRAGGRTARQCIESKYPELKDSLPLPSKLVSQATDPQIQLVNALKNRYTDLFRALLKQQDSEGSTLLNPDHWYGRPINATCLEMACRELGCEVFVRTLLEAGANPNMVNRISETSPIHITVEVGNLDALKVLLSFEETDVNATDKIGKTALHYIVNQNMDCEGSSNYVECLEVLLKHKDIDVNAQDSGGFSPVMLAALKGNRTALKIFLNKEINYHYVNLDCAPPTHSTPRRLILDTFPDLENILPDPCTDSESKIDYKAVLFQYLHKKQEEEFLSLLKTYGDVIPKTSSSFKDTRSETLLQCACKYGMIQAVKALLEFGYCPSDVAKDNKCPPIVTASINKNYDILKLLLEDSSYCNVNAYDVKGNTALHYAVRNSDLKSATLLLKHGADPECKNSLGKYPMNSKDLEIIFDKCINDNGKFPREEEYEVEFDYHFITSYGCKDNCVSGRKDSEVRILVSGNSEDEDNGHDGKPDVELNLIHFMSQTKGYRELLNHPIVYSFLDFKWRKLRIMSYLNLGIYILFLIALTLYISPYGRVVVEHDNYASGKEINESNFQNSTENEIIRCSESSIITGVILGIFIAMLMLREVLQFRMSWKRYFKRSENYLDLAIIVLSSMTLVTPRCHNNEVLHLLTVLVVLLTWTELMFLIGRISKFAKNIEMLKLVLKNYLTVSLFYSIIFIAFVLSFHILLWNVKSPDNWYDTFPMSFLKTFVMISGEFDVNKSFFQSIPIVANILFVLFVMIVSIVILNLLIGIAVNDTQSIQKDAELLCLETRVKVAWEIESILIGHYTRLRNKFPFLDLITIFPDPRIEKFGIVRPNESTEIKLSSGQNSLRLKSEVMDKVMKIINKRVSLQTPSDNDHRWQEQEEKLNKIESTLAELMEMMQTKGGGRPR